MILASIVKSLVIVAFFAGIFWLYRKIKGGKEWKEKGPDAAMNKYIDTGFNVALFTVPEKKTEAFWQNKEAVESTRKYLIWNYHNKTDSYEAGKRLNEILKHYEPEHAVKIITGFAENAEKEYLSK